MRNLPVHRSILAVDIERSTGALRTNPIKAELRGHVYRVLHQALTFTGISPEHVDPFEDGGDSVLALIHPVDDVPKTYLLSRFIPELSRLLTNYNAGLSPADRPSRELRLRAVVHAGEVHLDGNGYFGEELDVACRLLNAPRFKRFLKGAPGPLALIVSDDIHRAIVKHEYDGIRLDAFLPQVRVHVSGRRRQGWVHLPDGASTPMLVGGAGPYGGKPFKRAARAAGSPHGQVRPMSRAWPAPTSARAADL
ncbi:hypothetical protein [Actinomadura alba]|uniref:Guanylate cyclase domain-containing protein n=1 Tax=Actinomadura alba TaxID=406431 RepID=A0ABR7LT35_9ACTN|nr:hypothetical protein [Actinomadura alba]MBC6468008.1 hypothetical protein [Actinomadura alba]